MSHEEFNNACQVVMEMLEQIKHKDNWTNQKIGCQVSSQLCKASASYALPARDRTVYGTYNSKPVKYPAEFPWKQSPENRVRELAISGAYLLMEIHRLTSKREHQDLRY